MHSDACRAIIGSQQPVTDTVRAEAIARMQHGMEPSVKGAR
jgi:hypothetical protein